MYQQKKKETWSFREQRT